MSARVCNAFLLALTLLAPISSAHANNTQLKRLAFGCADKADFENLTRLANELPKGSFRTEAVLAYRKAHCIALARGRVTIDLWDGAYACVHRSPHSCVWVRRELVEKSLLDDGVF